MDETVSCHSAENQADTGLKGDLHMYVGGVAMLLCCNCYLFSDVLISPYQNFVTRTKTNYYTICVMSFKTDMNDITPVPVLCGDRRGTRGKKSLMRQKEYG